MRAAYALLGLVVGIVINEALRRGMRPANEQRDPQCRLGQSRSRGKPKRPAGFPVRSQFVALDYYDR